MEAPSRRGTGAGCISSHFNSGAGKSAKVADNILPEVRFFLSLTSTLCWSFSSKFVGMTTVLDLVRAQLDAIDK